MISNDLEGRKIINILVVDDEQPIRTLLKRQILKIGYDCFLSKSVRQALAILEESRIDLILTDIKMPEIDGVELIHIVKGKYDADIIAMTGFVDEYSYEDVIGLGASDFITKPCSENELRARIKRVLRERELISDLKSAEKVLREKEGLFQVMFEHSHDLLSVADEDGRTLWANTVWREKLGYSAENQGDPFEKVHPEDIDRIIEKYKSMDKDEAAFTDIEYRYRKDDGACIDLETTARKIEVGGTPRLFVAAHDISARKQSEKILRESETRYRALVEDMPALVCRFYPDGTLSFVNSAYCNYFQKDRNDLVGKDFFQFIPDENREDVKSQFIKLTKEKPTTTYEHKVVAANGEIRWQRWTDHALFVNGDQLIEYQSIGFDITDRKLSEESILKHKETLRKINKQLDLERRQLFSIFNSISEIIYVTDPATHEILFVNEHLRNFYQHDLVGEICYKVFQHLTVPCDFCTNEIILKNRGEAYRWEYYNPVLDKYFAVTDRIIQWPDGRDVRFELAIDNTKAKRAEKESFKLIKELERSNKELDDFAYTVSHDLKEPLRGMRNTASFLIEDFGETIGADGQKKLNTLIELCGRQENLIESVLYYSRVGRLDLSFSETDMNDLVLNVVDSMSSLINQENVEIKIADTLPKIACDPVKIREVVQNLISNAIKYNDRDKKHIEIGSKMDSSEKKANIFYVRDNGIGIREKHFDSIFEIFRRLHARDKYSGGTGAGLTIVKKIIERHGGQIWVESVLNEGSTFYFTISGEQYAG